MAEIPASGPDCFARRRAAYFEYTRGTADCFTEVHNLMVRDRALLPEPKWNALEATRHQIGWIIAGEHGEDALALLDTQRFNLRQVEATLAAVIAIATEEPALPAPAPTLAPTPPTPRENPAKVTWMRHFPAVENSPFLGDLSRISGVTAPAGLVFEPHDSPSG